MMLFRTQKKILKNTSGERGITLLLVIVILSAILSISIGIFNIVFVELRISGELSDSFIAFYAADRAIDKFLYLDRTAPFLNDGNQEDTTPTASPNGCYVVQIFKTPATISSQCGATGVNVCIKSIGEFQCGTTTSRLVKRGFMLIY